MVRRHLAFFSRWKAVNDVSKAQSAVPRCRKSTMTRRSGRSYDKNLPRPFCEWLAGLIDGAGSIQVDTFGRPLAIVNAGPRDVLMLQFIQNKLGGNVEQAGQGYVYQLKQRHRMIKLLNCINGHNQDPERVLEMYHACRVLNTPLIPTISLDAQSSWFAGFFDAVGTIGIALELPRPQVIIEVSSKCQQDVENYKRVFDGDLDSIGDLERFHQWYLHSRKDVLMMRDYFRRCTFRSHRSRRFFLIKEFYSLYDLRAFERESIHCALWLRLLDKWNKWA